MKRHIRPVAKANGINKNIGWHTFRHSFGTLLKANGEDVKTVQELLRMPIAGSRLMCMQRQIKAALHRGVDSCVLHNGNHASPHRLNSLRGAWRGYL